MQASPELTKLRVELAPHWERVPWLIPAEQLDTIDAAVEELPFEHQAWARDRVRKPGD
jgi:hypothetical protein